VDDKNRVVTNSDPKGNAKEWIVHGINVLQNWQSTQKMILHFKVLFLFPMSIIFSYF